MKLDHPGGGSEEEVIKSRLGRFNPVHWMGTRRNVIVDFTFVILRRDNKVIWVHLWWLKFFV